MCSLRKQLNKNFQEDHGKCNAFWTTNPWSWIPISQIKWNQVRQLGRIGSRCYSFLLKKIRRWSWNYKMEFSYQPEDTHWHMWSRSPLKVWPLSVSMEQMGTAIACPVLSDIGHCPPTCAWMLACLKMREWCLLGPRSPAACIPPPRWLQTSRSYQRCPKLHYKKLPDALHSCVCWFHQSVAETWTLEWDTELVVSHLLWRFTGLPPFKVRMALKLGTTCQLLVIL